MVAIPESMPAHVSMENELPQDVQLMLDEMDKKKPMVKKTVRLR